MFLRLEYMYFEMLSSMSQFIPSPSYIPMQEPGCRMNFYCFRLILLITVVYVYLTMKQLWLIFLTHVVCIQRQNIIMQALEQ
jgi:hypothetical protein